MLLEKGYVIVMDGDAERALLDVVAGGFLKVEVTVTTEVALGLDHLSMRSCSMGSTCY